MKPWTILAASVAIAAIGCHGAQPKQANEAKKPSMEHADAKKAPADAKTEPAKPEAAKDATPAAKEADKPATPAAPAKAAKK